MICLLNEPLLTLKTAANSVMGRQRLKSHGRSSNNESRRGRRSVIGRLSRKPHVETSRAPAQPLHRKDDDQALHRFNGLFHRANRFSNYLATKARQSVVDSFSHRTGQRAEGARCSRSIRNCNRAPSQTHYEPRRSIRSHRLPYRSLKTATVP